jgi:SNF2 family DNA or RNA helicase
MFTEDTRKKHKVFQDGVLSIRHREHRVKLLNIEGKYVFSRIMPPNFKCSTGNEIEMGRYLVEVGESLSAKKFLAGSVFIHGSDPISEEKPNSSLKRKFAPIPISKDAEPSKAFKPHTSLRLPFAAQKIVDSPQYLHDPFAAGALVLNADAAGLSKEPDQSQVMKFVIDPKKVGTQIPIVVDPYLSKHLRNHQQDGVQFMFHCVGGARGGCILADDMGLGKTIQTIALIWTLLKQGVTAPFTIKQALVVVPTTLVANWEREFAKWLGRERLRVIALSSNLKPEQQQSALHDFSTMAASFPVLIISYEMLRKHREAISHSSIGLLVCDEGHRLKSSESKTLDCLCGLNIPRRILLTGTPVQVRFHNSILFIFNSSLGGDCRTI